MPRNTGFYEMSLHGRRFEPVEVPGFPDGHTLYRMTAGIEDFTSSTNPDDHVAQVWLLVVGVPERPGWMRVSVGWTHPSCGGKCVMPLLMAQRGPQFWPQVQEFLDQHGLFGLTSNEECRFTARIRTNHTPRTWDWCSEPHDPPKSPGRPRLDGSSAEGYLAARRQTPTTLGYLGIGLAVGLDGVIFKLSRKTR